MPFHKREEENGTLIPLTFVSCLLPPSVEMVLLFLVLDIDILDMIHFNFNFNISLYVNIWFASLSIKSMMWWNVAIQHLCKHLFLKSPWSINNIDIEIDYYPSVIIVLIPPILVYVHYKPMKPTKHHRWMSSSFCFIGCECNERVMSHSY